MPITVRATEDEVRAALHNELTEEEIAQLRLELAEDAGAGSAFSPAPRRAEPITAATVIIWVISGIAGGLAYDATKILAKKVRDVLARRLGHDRVSDDAE